MATFEGASTFILIAFITDLDSRIGGAERTGP
jgi:hypothetical protein